MGGRVGAEITEFVGDADQIVCHRYEARVAQQAAHGLDREWRRIGIMKALFRPPGKLTEEIFCEVAPQYFQFSVRQGA